MTVRAISRRSFLAAGAAGFAAGLAPQALAQEDRTALRTGRKPNVVFILADDLGWADLGCYGNRFHETPRIDALAAQGMRFTDAYAAAPVCSPTRASIMTGQYPAHVGITDFIPGHQRPWARLCVPRNRTQYLPLEYTTLAEVMKSGGYTTGLFGKWHLGRLEYFPDKQGFDEAMVSDGRHFDFETWPKVEHPKDDYLAEFLTDKAADFMERHKDEPFFLFVSHFAVHIPLEARQELIEKYERKPKPGEGIHNSVYAAMVEHVDTSVGRVMDKLEKLGLAEDTVVVFFSDNGGLRRRYDGEGPLVTSNAPLRDEKGSIYEGGIREPLVVRWPGVTQAGTVCSEPVSSVDLLPTFAEVAGQPAPEGVDGVSLTPALESRKMPRRPLFWHYPHYHHSTPAGAIRQGRWKLIEFFEDGKLELYDLESDIGETRNLAAEMPARAERLHRKLAEWRQEIHAAMPTPNPDHDPAREKEWGKPIW